MLSTSKRLGIGWTKGQAIVKVSYELFALLSEYCVSRIGKLNSGLHCVLVMDVEDTETDKEY